MNPPLFPLCCIFVFFSLANDPSLGAEDIRHLADREVARRKASVIDGQAALERARKALKANDFVKAHDEFRTAANFLPDALTTADQHDAAVEGFCESGVKLAEQRIAFGRYQEADAIIREVVSDRYDPNCRAALTLLAHLSEPGYFNKTIGPNFVAKVEEVRKLLSDAENYYESGRYDLAFKKYEQVLNLDPYNVAARRGEERLNLTRTRYSEEAYNETRSRQLWKVQQGWEEPVRRYGDSIEPVNDGFAHDVTGTARITNKLNNIIIPKIDFRDASIREAIDYLRQQAIANDPANEGKKGVDIVLRTVPLGSVSPLTSEPSAAPQHGNSAEPEVEPTPLPATTGSSLTSLSPSEARITLILNQIPLGEALRYIASQAGLKVKVEPYAVSIIPINEQSNDLFTKEYRVPPGFITSSVNISVTALSQSATKAAATGTGKDTQESTGGQQLVNRQSALDFLKDQGVPFPPGASANFLPQSSRLIVRNTQENLELVDALVEQANVAGPKQVEIEAKFVEITQNNLKELGFDWLLGQFNIPGSDSVFGGGGTTGQVTGPGVPANSPNYPFQLDNGVPVGQFPVTSGNRSGTTAITANAIDALLFPLAGATSVAPGIFGLSGVFTDPQFQVVIRALNQKKGIDLLSAPRVTTKSGQRAVIEIVREFRYPTKFEPPQIPTTFNPPTQPGLLQGQAGQGTAFPVTPTTPTDFETRNTGVTLEVEPVVGPDGVTIDLNLVPQVVEFEGFINYGSPIQTFSTNALGISQTQVLTPNIINQPIFNSRKVTTSVSVWDGQTVVLGGLMREDVQKTEDKTPLLGDIPVVGRLFRSNAEQHIKRNLIIFVTARLVNPAGQPLNALEEEEESEETSNFVEPPVLPKTPYYKK